MGKIPRHHVRQRLRQLAAAAASTAPASGRRGTGKKIAEAIAAKIGPVQPLPPDDPKSALAAFTVKGQADAINAQIDNDCKEAGVIDLTAKYGARLVKKECCDYMRPTVIYCETP